MGKGPKANGKADPGAGKHGARSEEGAARGNGSHGTGPNANPEEAAPNRPSPDGRRDRPATRAAGTKAPAQSRRNQRGQGQPAFTLSASW